MIIVGIDVAKDKHDCIIINTENVVLAEPFTIPNTLEGFSTLLESIHSVWNGTDKLKVGLEATGHYCYNLIGFLLKNDLPIYVLNPLHTNLYRKSLTLRKTKTDKIDARVIASLIMTDPDLRPYTNALYHSEELKSLTRYRFDKVHERAKLKVSVTRLVTILFPELEKLVSTLHGKAVYTMLSEFPSATHIAHAHLTRLTNILYNASKAHYNKLHAVQIREAARSSIGTLIPVKALELKHTIKLIGELTEEIDEIEAEIKRIVDETGTTLLTIPGLGYTGVSSILAEIGDFSNFANPNKVLAYAGMSPSTYQSGQLNNCYSHMEKRGSKYLRYALYNAAKSVCKRDKTFAEYLAKKRAEGKHYNVAVSHAAKKLVRLIFAMEKSHLPYQSK